MYFTSSTGAPTPGWTLFNQQYLAGAPTPGWTLFNQQYLAGAPTPGLTIFIQLFLHCKLHPEHKNKKFIRLKIYMRENTEGTRCDISGTGEKPRPISSSPEKDN